MPIPTFLDLHSPVHPHPLGSLDDVVACTFLAGNDFVPQLPSLDIYDRPSALQTLLDKYKARGGGQKEGSEEGREYRGFGTCECIWLCLAASCCLAQCLFPQEASSSVAFSLQSPDTLIAAA